MVAKESATDKVHHALGMSYGIILYDDMCRICNVNLCSVVLHFLIDIYIYISVLLA